MKKIVALCIVTTVVTSVSGCGCLRRLRDFACRGAYCGGPAVAAPAPIAAPPVVPMAAPMAYEPGCQYGGLTGYDPGCGYMGPQTYGYGSVPAYDSGWMPAGPACESCNGGYALPAYDGGYPVDSGSVAPGPAPIDNAGGR